MTAAADKIPNILVGKMIGYAKALCCIVSNMFFYQVQQEIDKPCAHIFIEHIYQSVFYIAQLVTDLPGKPQCHIRLPFQKFFKVIYIKRAETYISLICHGKFAVQVVSFQRYLAESFTLPNDLLHHFPAFLVIIPDFNIATLYEIKFVMEMAVEVDVRSLLGFYKIVDDVHFFILFLRHAGEDVMVTYQQELIVDGHGGNYAEKQDIVFEPLRSWLCAWQGFTNLRIIAKILAYRSLSVWPLFNKYVIHGRIPQCRNENSVYDSIFRLLFLFFSFPHPCPTFSIFTAINFSMLKSMTGFGRSEQTKSDRTVLIEIKSLNGKQLEMNLKMPSLLKAYEFDIRNAIAELLLRGSVDCFINVKQNGASKPVSINTDVAKAYYQTIAELSADLNLDTSQVLSALLKLPEVVTPATDVIDDEGWALVKATMQEALSNLNNHRFEEGSVLEKELGDRIKNIQLQQVEVAKLEPARLVKKKEGIKKLLEDNIGKENYDENRLEQELIYFIEKIDITEEQVRLTNHCEYFFAMLAEAEEAKGKKLGFLLQEIGREINTIGSKAYDATIQKCVVLMKDELEKAKEQVLNVL